MSRHRADVPVDGPGAGSGLTVAERLHAAKIDLAKLGLRGRALDDAYESGDLAGMEAIKAGGRAGVEQMQRLYDLRQEAVAAGAAAQDSRARRDFAELRARVTQVYLTVVSDRARWAKGATAEDRARAGAYQAVAGMLLRVLDQTPAPGGPS